MQKPMRVPPRVVLTLVLPLVGGSFACSQSSKRVPEDSAEQEWKEFRLDDLQTKLRAMEPGTEQDYFNGLLANRTGRIAESIELLEKVLPAIRVSQADRAAVSLETLADDYFKSYRYADAAGVMEDLLTHFPEQLKGEKLEHTKDDAKVAQILRGAPAQTIIWNGTTALKTERNPLNSQNVELTVNGVRGAWLLDTGANLSVVTKSFAERLGLKPLEGVSQTQAGLTGIENPVRIALLPALEMGGATLHNVVVMVLEDASLNINMGKQSYQINAIVGYPVLQALGTVTFHHDGMFEAGRKMDELGKGARMFMKQLTPIIECEVEGKKLPFAFDTGASDTDFFVRYSELFHKESRSWKKGKEKSAGAGGTVQRKIYFQPEVKLGVGDKVVILKKVPIYRAGTGTDSGELYGNLGQDVVADFESFTLDFSEMQFRLGESLRSGKAQ